MEDDRDELWLLYQLAIETPEQKAASRRALKEFREEWVGRVFQCALTGETLVIPDDVRMRQYFTFGESSLDTGDGYYSRFGGYVVEIEKEKE